MKSRDSLYFAGIDLGSTMTKVVIIDGDEKIRARVESHTGAEHRRLANKVMEEALEQADLSFAEIDYVVATGYGRINVPFADRQITELTCHARGVFSLFPLVKTALDIGGQDAKGLKIKNGKLVDFVMNDKCAAGTGRFLEVIAKTLGLRLEDLGSISLKSANRVSISNTCTIFAQQEVISHLSEGIPLEDIVAGLHEAIAICDAAPPGQDGPRPPSKRRKRCPRNIARQRTYPLPLRTSDRTPGWLCRYKARPSLRSSRC